jgi:ribulose-5-phosphate 4-epimerase/fuculose-1-phosphate aldolase
MPSHNIARGEENPEIRTLRVELAAAFRIAAELDWHESVGNHFSATVASDGKRFLLNPRWLHFSRVRASDLLLLDSDDAQTLSRPNAPDPSAWCIHGRLHARRPDARVVLHLHPPYATALACLKDPRLKPIEQCSARFFNRVAIDHGFSGIADHTAEGERLVTVMGAHRHMILGNHGIIVTADTVAEAFEDMYTFERAARTLMLAYASGQPLNVMPDAVAEQTARDWEDYRGMGFAHFHDLKAMLDARDPSYAD